MEDDHLRTAQALQRITDRGKFELLVADVLWVAEPRYRSLLSTGVNAQGEPVRGVVDGVARVPGAVPPQLLMLATTTINPGRLSGKFAEDLRKAAELATRLRKTTGDASFTLILATNECLSVKLFERIHELAAAEKIDLDLWDQGRLARFLDLDPRGQWIRRHFLGIKASMLSPKLVQSLSTSSLGEYASCLLVDPRELMERSRVDTIVETLANEATTLVAIVAESGYGKSTAILQALHRRQHAGDTALWVTADHIAAAASPATLIANVLADLNGAPVDDPLSFFQRSRSTSRKRLLLAVDDLNRADGSQALLRKVVQWAKMISQARETVPAIGFIVPLWPNVFHSIESDARHTDWQETIELSRFTRRETLDVLTSSGTPATVIHDVADHLGDDPFLVGRFQAVVAKRETDIDHIALANTVLDSYLRDIERELATTITLGDATLVHQTLIALARKEIDHATLQPTLHQVREWLPSAHQVLDTVLRSGRLLVRRHTRTGDELQFRHDRLHDQLLGEAMAALLHERSGHSAPADPFFARVTGVALTIVDDDAVHRAAKDSPPAVFEALRLMGNRSTPRRNLLFEIALQWIDKESASVASQIRRHVLSALFDADSNLVLPLTEPLRDSSLRRLVRLRAGDAASGASYCADSSSFAFSDPRVQRATEHAMRFHREKLVQGAAQLLRGAADDRTRHGALSIAGWTGAAELAHDSFACWETSDDRDALMPAAMWAALRCAQGKDVEILSRLLDQILLPVADKEKTRRYDVFTAAHSYSRIENPDAMRAMDEEAKKDAPRARTVLALLLYVDDPTVIDIFLRVADAGAGLDFMTMQLYSDWSKKPTRRRRSRAESRIVLTNTWTDETRPLDLRKQAFDVWSRSAIDDDLDTLRSFDRESPFHIAAIRARARIGDRGVASDLAAHITGTDFGLYDLSFAPHVWTPELYNAADILLRRYEGHLEQERDCGCDVHYIVSELLVKIPAADAERLLISHWSMLQHSRKYIQTALFLGTPTLMDMATEAIRARVDDSRLFEYIAIRFLAFHTDEDGVLTTDHLDRLLPFVDRIPEDEISRIIADAARRGWRRWIVDHFAVFTSYLPDKHRGDLRKRYLPEEADLCAELKTNPNDAYGWIRDLEQRAIPPEQVVDAALLAITDPCDPATWAAACEILEHLGTRTDITRFEPHVPDTPESRSLFVGAAFEIRLRSLR